MRRALLFFTTLVVVSYTLQSQTESTFDDLTLAADTFWNGADEALGTTFMSGNATYVNYYDTAFGGYWATGWAYSSVEDSTTAGFTNLYGARTGIGYDGSSNYAVGQQGAKIILNEEARGVVEGVYITNSTYAARSMEFGDFVAKQFGDSVDANGLPDGTNGEDFFSLTIKGWWDGNVIEDSVVFYLADYRFDDNSQDYIVEDWRWVDLTPLGNVDSIWFTMRSSDVGQFGINTPLFFCIDDFTTRDDTLIGIENRLTSQLSVFPNPCKNNLIVENLNPASQIQIMDLSGKTIKQVRQTQQTRLEFNLSGLPSGIYFIQVMDGMKSETMKFVKS